MKKYAFVTGGNKGIGFEVVRELAERDVHVFLGARNEELGIQAVEVIGCDNVRFIQVDVTSSESIQHSLEQIREVTDHLDILLNNAGIAPDFGVAPLKMELGMLKKAFDVNFFGTFQMIQAFYPLLQKSERGKIINVTTDMASQTRFANGEAGHLNLLAYNSSKTAANSLTLTFGREFGEDGPEIFSVTPGFTSTDLNGNAPGGKTPAEGAKIIVNYIESEESYNGKLLDTNGIMPW
ncbi:short-chain dehydrogenase [Bacillus coahuilensis m2-6]|uniref:SDR family NAD(P)-dependent oxidoreductase n=1 Tax=Bacillus coahuilensis TaxID=408580 RepID=UPI00018512C1|nr:SDR family NAD(P)-dependent oxidoreductase [Bacillus coahuilensis]KUP03964.1 short-chain dehydrogenase [Bacillus coahuilensis m2-6]